MPPTTERHAQTRAPEQATRNILDGNFVRLMFGLKWQLAAAGPPLTSIVAPIWSQGLAQRVWEDRLRAQLKWSERLFFPALRLSTRQKG